VCSQSGRKGNCRTKVRAPGGQRNGGPHSGYGEPAER
jgi:hypothetical protein